MKDIFTNSNKITRIKKIISHNGKTAKTFIRIKTTATTRPEINACPS